MRLLWYAAPFTHSPAHEGTDWITTHRLLAMDRHSQVCARGFTWAAQGLCLVNFTVYGNEVARMLPLALR